MKLTGENQFPILEAPELVCSSSDLLPERMVPIARAACSRETEAEIGFTEQCTELDSRIKKNLSTLRTDLN